VQPGAASAVHLVLVKLPGQLQIDTAGVVAAVSIDGVARSLAPGVLTVPAGERTVSLRRSAYRRLPTTLTIQARAELHVRLQSAWGTLT